MKIVQAVSEKMLKDVTILYMHIAKGQGQIPLLGDKMFIVTKKFYNFNHTLYVSAISHLIHFDKNDFSLFSTYKCMCVCGEGGGGSKFDLAVKRSKGHLRPSFEQTR